MSAVLAGRSGCDGALGPAVVALTTLLGVLTIPLWVAGLRRLGP